MVEEEELEDRALHLLDARSFGAEGEPFLRVAVARDLRLGHAVHLDQAHPAVAVHAQPRVIAEVRDLDLGGARRLDQIEPFLDLDLAIVDLDLDLRHSPRLLSASRPGSARSRLGSDTARRPRGPRTRGGTS